MTFQAINASASPETQMNENFETAQWVSVYGRRQPVEDGLTWGYGGGRWGGFEITEGTLTLTDNSANYIVVERATGTISVSTSITNWSNLADYARVYRIQVVGGTLTIIEDHRAGPGGVFGGNTTVGRHEVPIMAAAMRPRTTNGCAALAQVEIVAGQPDLVTLDFDASTTEYAQFSIPMPKSWNFGTVRFRPIWSHASGGSAFGVVWGLQGVALQDGDAIGASFGAAQTSADTGGTANDMYVGPESSAITVVPASLDENVTVFFQVYRDTGSGSDTLDIDARLHGIVLIIETAAENDE